MSRRKAQSAVIFGASGGLSRAELARKTGPVPPSGEPKIDKFNQYFNRISEVVMYITDHHTRAWDHPLNKAQRAEANQTGCGYDEAPRSSGRCRAGWQHGWAWSTSEQLQVAINFPLSDLVVPLRELGLLRLDEVVDVVLAVGRAQGLA